MARITKEVLYLRRDFTQDEKLDMGSKLAESHNLMADIAEEEAIMKSQIKERKSQVEATIGTLSRHLANGYQMENVDCELLWDSPHVGEVSYQRKDNNQIVPNKTRAMTESENQQEIDFHESKPLSPVLVMSSAEESASNIAEFFGETSVDAMTAQDAGNSAVVDEEAVFSSTDPEAAVEAIRPEHDAAWGGAELAEKPGRGRPKGSKNKPVETDDSEPF